MRSVQKIMNGTTHREFKPQHDGARARGRGVSVDRGNDLVGVDLPSSVMRSRLAAVDVVVTIESPRATPMKRRQSRRAEAGGLAPEPLVAATNEDPLGTWVRIPEPAEPSPRARAAWPVAGPASRA